MKLELNQLRKFFGSQKAIGPLNLLIPECKTLVLIGPSGSGKSTLLRLISGLQYPDSGEILIDDVPIVYKRKELLAYRRKLGIVFQSWNLFPHLTALENIVLPLYRVHGFSNEEAEKRALELLNRFQMEKHAYKKPYALSGGQVQRIALIRALAPRPKMLLLDEPTSQLDPLMTAEVLELVLELKKEGQDLILATHHLQFAKKIADTLLFLADGKILESGSADQVIEHPTSSLAKKYMATLFEY